MSVKAYADVYKHRTTHPPGQGCQVYVGQGADAGHGGNETFPLSRKSDELIKIRSIFPRTRWEAFEVAMHSLQDTAV